MRKKAVPVTNDRGKPVRITNDAGEPVTVTKEERQTLKRLQSTAPTVPDETLQ